MKKYALVILTANISVRKFEHKDDFDTARQTIITAGKKCIPLKFHQGIKKWVQPEVYEW